MTRRCDDKTQPDPLIERKVYEALKKSGRLIPTTPEDVARVDSENDQHSVQLPTQLLNLDVVFEGALPPLVGPSGPSLGSSEVEENLGRAAREGADQIPEDILKQMRQDRDEAEKKARREKE